MSITYSLVENPLIRDRKMYRARVLPKDVIDKEGLVSSIMNMGSSLTVVDVMGVIDAVSIAVARELKKGNAIHLPFMNIGLGIKGGFEDVADSYDRSRHVLHTTISAGVELRRAIATGVQVEKVRSVSTSPEIDTFIDSATEESDSLVTAGGIGEIKGYRLKFDKADPAQGVFFIAEGGTETRVSVYSRIKPSDCIFSIPLTLVAGKYTLSIRIKTTEALESASFYGELTVA